MSEKLNQLYAKENNGDYEQDFMRMYLGGLVQYLLECHSEEIYSLQYRTQEQNIDEPLKRLLQNVILNEYKSYPGADYHIENVFIQNELEANKELKELVKGLLHERTKAYEKAEVAYTNPDLTLKIVSNRNESDVFYDTIELKSTSKSGKGDIVGSCINQVYPNEWLIFVYHHKDSKEGNITFGRYGEAVVTCRVDYRVRPIVSFQSLKDNEDGEHKKLSIEGCISVKEDWRNTVSENAFNNLTNDKANSQYDQANRGLVLQVFNEYEKMSDEEKIQFRNKLTELFNR